MEPSVARPRQRASVTRRITVPGNLRLACEQFNSGRFFECHETLEEVWQQENGELNGLYKGIIQVAAAFVHVGRGNGSGADRLFATALAYLAPFRANSAMGFDVEALCQTAERAREALSALAPGQTVALSLSPRPELRWDESCLAAEARRRGAWGFDPDGNPLEMEITVIE